LVVSDSVSDLAIVSREIRR